MTGYSPAVGPYDPPLIATKALGLTLAAVFAAELALSFGPLGTMLAPSLQTLVAFGGASRGLVVGDGEWFRLLTMAFAHAHLLHLAMNGLGLWLVGRTLEPVLGARWFLAVFFVGALSGSIASVSFNPPSIVGVGASGALMGLFGFLLAFALRLPSGEHRKAFATSALSVLIPSLAPALLPLFLPGQGLQIDYAAHAGGALAGAAIAALSPLFWPKIWIPVGYRQIAGAIVAAGILVCGYGAVQLASRHDEYKLLARLIPAAEIPATEAAFQEQSADLVARFPEDPRARFHRAIALIRAGDAQGAEREARTAMEIAERYPRSFTRDFRDWARLLLAGAQQEQGRMAEARTTARPLCATSAGTGRIRDLLNRYKLCEQERP